MARSFVNDLELADADDYRKLDEIPFDFRAPMLSVVVEGKRGRDHEKARTRDRLAVCTSYDVDGALSSFEDAARVAFIPFGR